MLIRKKETLDKGTGLAHEANGPIFVPSFGGSLLANSHLMAYRQGQKSDGGPGKGLGRDNSDCGAISKTGVIYIGGGIPKNYSGWHVGQAFRLYL
jgi:deoxyhypusine synthase